MIGFKATFRYRCVAFLSVSMLMACAAHTRNGAMADAQAEGADRTLRTIELGLCALYERTTPASSDTPNRPRFLMLNGVPATSLIYENLAARLAHDFGVVSILLDLPGTGGSTLATTPYTWKQQGDCLHKYIQEQGELILVLHDIAAPIVVPRLPQLRNVRGVVVLNALLEPSRHRLPFPLNCLRGCGPLSRPLANMAPFFFYEWRIRNVGISRDEAVSTAWFRQLYKEVSANNGMDRLVDVLRGVDFTPDADLAIRKGLEYPVPQLFIWGDADPALGKQRAVLEPLHAHQQLKILSDAKHFLMIDHATEISAFIGDWLRTWSWVAAPAPAGRAAQ